MSQSAPKSGGVEPFAIDGDAAAALFGIGRSTWFKLRAAGRTPRPRRLGRRVLFDVAELKAWWAAGAPALDEWEAMQKLHVDGGGAGGER